MFETITKEVKKTKYYFKKKNNYSMTESGITSRFPTEEVKELYSNKC